MVSSLFLFLALLSLLFAVDARPSPSLSRASHQRHQHQRHRHHQTQPNFTEVDTIIASLKQQVVSDDADLIIDTLVNGAYKGVTYDRLANFTDTIGPRVCGSETLEGAVQFMIDRLTEDGLENVHAEQVVLPYWSRGRESATLQSPRVANLNMLGLGGSVGTQKYGSAGLTADVLVVANFDELTEKADQAVGKIVLFNEQCDWQADPIGCYGKSVVYRGIGAQKVAAVGGLASLIRSVAAFSMNSPHTGMMDGYGNGPEIPTAALTLEDSDMLQRMSDRGQRITITLQMEAEMVTQNAVGHNVVAEIVGSQYPDEVIIVSGHLDSWDVGQGAMDDGGGALISWSVLSVLRSLNMRPLRTIRLVMWSCEEFGGVGAQQYYTAHANDSSKMSLVMESDLGVFHPDGLQFTGNQDATQIMTAIGQLLAHINATLVTTGGEGTDISPWMSAGVPGASLANDNERYFWFHHSNADTMSVLNSADIDKCAAVWAVHAYSVANLPSLLPRGNK